MASSSVLAVSCAMPERTEAWGPASTFISISLPVTADTTMGPLTNSAPLSLMTVTSVMPAMAEAMPPHWPSTSEIWGTTPDSALTRPAICA